MATLTSNLIVRLLDQVSVPAKKVAGALRGLNVEAGKQPFNARLRTAIDRNSAALNQTRGKLVDAAAGFYAVRAAIGAPMAAAANFETILEDIGQKAEIPRERLQALGQALRRIGSEVNTTGSKMAEAMDRLVGMGASEADAQKLLPDVGRAASAYRAEIADLAAAGFAALDNLKVPADKFSRALDAMAAAGKAGAFELKDMAQYFPSLGASYQALGQKGVPAVADLAAALQIARKGAGDSAEAANNLRNVLQKISAPQTRKAFAGMGVNLEKELTRAAKSGLSPIEAIAEVTNKALKGNLGKLGDLFADAQVQAGLRPLIQNLEEYRRIRREAVEAQGTVERDFARRAQTYAGLQDRWLAVTERLNVAIGNALLPALIKIGDALAPIVSRLGELADKYPQLATATVSATAGLVAFRVATIAASFAGLNLKGALLTMTLGLTRVGMAARWTALMMGAPLARAATGMIGMMQTIALRSRLATASLGTTPGILSRVGDALLVAGRSALSLLNPLRLLRGIAVVLRGALMFTGVGAVLSGIASAGTFIYNNWSGLTTMIQGVADGFMKGMAPLEPVLRPIGNIVRSIYDSISGLVGPLDVSTEKWRAWGEVIGGSVAQAIQAVVSGIQQIIGLFSSAYEKAVSFGRALKGMAGFGGGAPQQPAPLEVTPGNALAKGGQNRAGEAYLVGEEGPELWQSNKRGSVTPHKETLSLLRKGGSIGGGSSSSGGKSAIAGIQITMPVNIHGVQDIRGAAEEIGRQLDEKVRFALRGIHADVGVA